MAGELSLSGSSPKPWLGPGHSAHPIRARPVSQRGPGPCTSYRHAAPYRARAAGLRMLADLTGKPEPEVMLARDCDETAADLEVGATEVRSAVLLRD